MAMAQLMMMITPKSVIATMDKKIPTTKTLTWTKIKVKNLKVKKDTQINSCKAFIRKPNNSNTT